MLCLSKTIRDDLSSPVLEMCISTDEDSKESKTESSLNKYMS